MGVSYEICVFIHWVVLAILTIVVIDLSVDVHNNQRQRGDVSLNIFFIYLKSERKSVVQVYNKHMLHICFSLKL